MHKRSQLTLLILVYSSLLISLLFIVCILVVYPEGVSVSLKSTYMLSEDQVASSTLTIVSLTTKISIITLAMQTSQKQMLLAAQQASQDYLTMVLIPIILPLVSGLLGAIIGGYLTYKGSMDSAKSQINSLYEQEKENREYDQKRKKEIIRNTLKIEIQENLDLINAKSRKVNLSTEAWSTYKGNIALFSAPLQEELIRLYAEAKRYNSTLEQIHAMYLNKMDNDPLFSLQLEIVKQFNITSGSALKKLSKE